MVYWGWGSSCCVSGNINTDCVIFFHCGSIFTECTKHRVIFHLWEWLNYSFPKHMGDFPHYLFIGMKCWCSSRTRVLFCLRHTTKYLCERVVWRDTKAIKPHLCVEKSLREESYSKCSCCQVSVEMNMHELLASGPLLVTCVAQSGLRASGVRQGVVVELSINMAVWWHPSRNMTPPPPWHRVGPRFSSEWWNCIPLITSQTALCPWQRLSLQGKAVSCLRDDRLNEVTWRNW